MKKRFTLFLFAAVIAALLSGCSAAKLPEGITEEMVSGKADELIRMVTEERYEDIAAAFREDTRSEDLAEVIRDAMDAVQDENGAFVAQNEMMISGQPARENTEESVICLVRCDYEEGPVLFNFVFDTELALIGFWL